MHKPEQDRELELAMFGAYAKICGHRRERRWLYAVTDMEIFQLVGHDTIFLYPAFCLCH